MTSASLWRSCLCSRSFVLFFFFFFEQFLYTELLSLMGLVGQCANLALVSSSGSTVILRHIVGASGAHFVICEIWKRSRRCAARRQPKEREIEK